MNRCSSFALLALLAGALTSACGSSPPRPVPSARFACGGFIFQVSFRGDTAEVTTPDTAFALPIAISASGARYSDGLSTFWEHQGTARLELPDTSFADCPRL